MPVQHHVHKYKRNRLGREYTVYECALPDCTHYLPESRIVGKKSICWVCGKAHVIYKDSNGVLARPHCRACTKTTKKDKKEDFLDLPPLNIPNILP